MAEDLPIDLDQVPPVPIRKTLLLVNNFVTNTTRFLNHFSRLCESKLVAVASKTSELEILLTVVEAKLASIPGLDAAAPAQSVDSAALPPASAPAAPAPAAAAPPAPASTEMVPAEAPAAAEPAAAAAGPAVKDHPLYAKYFKLLNMGVPPPQIKHKMSMDGLNPDLLDDPDAPAPAEGAAPAGGGGGGAGGDSIAAPGQILALPPAEGSGGKPMSRIMFDKYDADGSGAIDARELKALVWDFGFHLADAAAALAQLDANGSGAVEFDEFIRWWPGFSSLSLDDEQLQRRRDAAGCFLRFDADRSGAISRAEFTPLFAELARAGLTRKTEAQCLADMDADGDGEVSYNELMRWLDG